MSEWKALNGRITLFPTAASSPSPSALELYRRVWGSDPDSFQKQPNALLPTIAQGSRNGITTSCFSHPTRIDFNLLPVSAPSEMADMSLVLIEDTNQLHADLMRIIGILAEGIVSNSVSRVALGVQFITVKPNLVEANRTLTKVMPDQYRIKLTDEEDFIFQINRPRMSSKVGTVRMNFLTKWSMERLQILTMAIPASGIATSKESSFTPANVREFLAASVSFDNNNAPTSALTSSQQSSLLLEGLTAAAAMQRDLGLNIGGF